MQAAPTIDPTEQAVALYERIAVPAHRLGRWSVRRARGISTIELESIAHSMISAFQELLFAQPLRVRVDVTEAAPDEEPGDATDEASQLESLNELLATVRRLRGQATSPGGKALVRTLRARRPELAKIYTDMQERVLERLADIEKMVVLLGAGVEADAELGADLIPTVPDLPAGPSVTFEL